ncbi:hypothetical protein KUTeg_003858 [Tegillarca granosa]|uniref:Oxidized purine nucleoside triphosphate hydrolase n=1 Tax=Tegillarca granosa TaxID=220873 RepID=A0ABQ9FQ46_TEGGR|nr:hypothetical protein KUTeg_003858 [Tegillarca granosa]
MLNKLLTLVLVREPSRVLLGLKKKGFGEGKWNGFGGKVEPGETILEGAKRELLEESGVVSNSLEEIGLLKFEFVGDPQILEVHVFTSNTFEGEIKESDGSTRIFLHFAEMRPQWFYTDKIPLHQMWADDKYWFPMFLKGSKFKGYFLFEGHEKIVKYQLDEVEKLNS